jgi:hypothetical protein
MDSAARARNTLALRIAVAACSLAIAAPSSLSADDLNCRDGKDAPPRLYLVQNLWGLQKYPSPADEWPVEKQLAEIKAAGFDAFDVWIGGMKPEEVEKWIRLAASHDLGLGVETGPEKAEDIDAAIATAQRMRSPYLDAHVANYFLPEPEAVSLLRAITARCKVARMPLVIQTHRGRVTQDLLRTVSYAKAVPDLRFDLDFSHYIVAGEITGNFGPAVEAAFSTLMERATMLDARVSNGESVQVDVGEGADSELTRRFASLWKRVMVSWLKGARMGDVFPFRIELGPPPYAILDRNGRELNDRWDQQKLLKALVERLWNEAVQETGKGLPHGKAALRQ